MARETDEESRNTLEAEWMVVSSPQARNLDLFCLFLIPLGLINPHKGAVLGKGLWTKTSAGVWGGEPASGSTHTEMFVMSWTVSSG